MSVDEYYNAIDRIFSDASLIYDSKILSNFINVYIRDVEVRTFMKYCPVQSKVIEVGFGTGEETRRIISMSEDDIVGIDISEGMVEYATEKMEKNGLSTHFKALRMPASRIMEVNGKFRCVYSFNGALNNEPRLDEFFSGLIEKLDEGGFFIVSIRNRFSLGEFIFDFIGRKPMKLAERMKGEVKVEVMGQEVDSHYFTSNEFIRKAGNKMKLVEKVGLSILFLPRFFEKFRGKRMQKIIIQLESIMSRIPLLNSFGDETLFVLRKE